MLCTRSNSVATSPSFSARTDERSSSSSAVSAARSAPEAARDAGLQVAHPRVGRGAGVDVAGEDHRGGGGAAEHRGERALQREHGHVRVQRLGEDHERAAVVARDHAEHDGPAEVHDRAADLGAVLQLQLAHRLRRAVEAGQVREHHQRPVAAGRVDRPRGLLRRPREQRARGVGVRAVGGREAAPRHRP